VTIAICYVSPEGVVLGADSTTTYGTHHFNNSQKLFEVGEDSSLAIVTSIIRMARPGPSMVQFEFDQISKA
jgi:hypothetical protein